MASADLLRLPDRSGATEALLVHFYDTTQIIRQLSVTKDFNPGAQAMSYFSLTDEVRKSVQFHLNQLNRHAIEPRQAVWGVSSIFSLRGETCFVAENLTANVRPRSRRDPVLLVHLANATADAYEVRSQLVVTDGFQPVESVYPYFNVAKNWRKAIKSELTRLNGHAEDMRDHPWALHSIHQISQGKPAEVVGVVMVLHWMSCEPMDNSLPAPHSSPMPYSRRPSPRQSPERTDGNRDHRDHLALPPYSI